MTYYSSHSSHIHAMLIILLVVPVTVWSRPKPHPQPDQATAYLSRPNRQTGMERLLGLGVVLPYPYFQKPRYRYPVYDREGRGSLAYGYGDADGRTFRYSKFDKLEGYH